MPLIPRKVLESYQPSHLRDEEPETSDDHEFYGTSVVSKQGCQRQWHLALIPRLVVAGGMLFIVHSDSQI